MAIEARYPQAFCFVAMFLYHSIPIPFHSYSFCCRIFYSTWELLHTQRGGGNSFKLGSVRCVVSKPTRNQVSCRHSTRGGDEERSRASLVILCNTWHRQKQRRRVTKTEVMQGTWGRVGRGRVLGVYVLPSLLKNMRWQVICQCVGFAKVAAA